MAIAERIGCRDMAATPVALPRRDSVPSVLVTWSGAGGDHSILLPWRFMVAENSLCVKAVAEVSAQKNVSIPCLACNS